jgi:hypothetical protein
MVLSAVQVTAEGVALSHKQPERRRWLVDLRDVQALAGHASLSTTSRYIETDSEAQAKLVNIV